MKKRILIFSDLHGQLNKLNKLLEETKYNHKDDLLIGLGDYVDRGYQNIQTLYKIKELKDNGAKFLRGNHDDLTIETIKELLNNNITKNTKMHIQCGGMNTYNELKQLTTEELKEIYDLLTDMPYYYTIGKYIFVHAGVNSHFSLDKNSSENFLWSRGDFLYNKAYKNKIVIFGHTPTYYIYNSNIKKHNPKIWKDSEYNDKIGIDCGSVFGGKLACLELPSMKEYYID